MIQSILFKILRNTKTAGRQTSEPDCKGRKENNRWIIELPDG